MNALFYILLGCQQGEQTVSVASPITNSAHAASTASLPDMKQGLSKEGCDNGPGGAGAASYFYDIITIEGWDGENAAEAVGKQAKGSEEWIMKANKKWEATGGGDCSVQWSLQGTTRAPSSCTSCTLGVSLINAIDKVGSTCPPKMAKTNTGESIGYDLLLRPDGTATAYFSRSGRKFADGYHKDGEVRLLSDMSCRWF